jgi:hypothetical protein
MSLLLMFVLSAQECDAVLAREETFQPHETGTLVFRIYDYDRQTNRRIRTESPYSLSHLGAAGRPERISRVRQSAGEKRKQPPLPSFLQPVF